MSATLPPSIKFQPLVAGVPLPGGKVYFYAAGTTTPQSVFADDGVTPLTNPLILDANGAGSFRLSSGLAYKINLTNAADVQVANWPVDNVRDLATLAVLASDLASTASGKGAALVGYLAPFTGAVPTTIDDVLRDKVYVTRFLSDAQKADVRAGTGAVDCTSAIQAAINYASQTQIREVVFPAGVYAYTRLYGYYDAAFNPGYNVNRNCELTLTGEGISPENGGSGGTVLKCTSSTGDGFTVSPTANDVTPWTGRDFLARGISFEGGPAGYLVACLGVPSARFENCQFVQTNLAGGGLNISTAYFGVLEKCRWHNTAVGTKTGDAIRLGTAIPAGLFTLRDCNVADFANGLNIVSGTWQVITIQDSEVAGSVYPIRVAATVEVLNLNGDYFEGACTSFVSDASSNKLQVLNMRGCWMHTVGATGPAINLTAPNGFLMDGCTIQDPHTAIVNIAALPSGGRGGYLVKNCNVFESSPYGSAVTYFTGVVPAFFGIDYPTGNANVSLFSAASRPIEMKASYKNDSYLAAGHMLETHTMNYGPVGGGSLDINADGNPSWITATCSGSSTIVYLAPISALLPHGYPCTVDCNTNSTFPLTVKTNTADGAATLGTVAAGTQRKFVFFRDGTTTGWL